MFQRIFIVSFDALLRPIQKDGKVENHCQVHESLTRGPMAHILHAGGPWKLESPRRHQETGVNAEARQANKVPGGRWGPRAVGFLRSRGGPEFGLMAWAPHRPPQSPPLFTNTEQSWAGPEKGLE